MAENRVPVRRNSSVGYRRPPLHSQFKRGVSGNPKGRPKASRNRESLRKLFMEALTTKIGIRQNGRLRNLSKFKVGFVQMANKFASGDTRTIFDVIGELRRWELQDQKWYSATGISEEKLAEIANKMAQLSDKELEDLQALFEKVGMPRP